MYIYIYIYIFILGWTCHNTVAKFDESCRIQDLYACQDHKLDHQISSKRALSLNVRLRAELKGRAGWEERCHVTWERSS